MAVEAAPVKRRLSTALPCSAQHHRAVWFGSKGSSTHGHSTYYWILCNIYGNNSCRLPELRGRLLATLLCCLIEGAYE